MAASRGATSSPPVRVTTVTPAAASTSVPAAYCPPREADVCWAVIAEADDPRMIVGRAVGMAKLELFEPEYPRPGAGGPVGDGAAEAAEPDDDEVMVAFHRSALIVPLLAVPGAPVRLGSTL